MAKTSNAVKTEKVGFVPKKEVRTYALAALGQGLVYSCMSSYVTDYYMNVLALDAMFVILLMLIARVWDAVYDPFIGMAMDRKSTKWGRMKPYPVITAIPIAILTILMFVNPGFDTKNQSVGLYVFVAVSYVLWGMVYSVSDVPFWSLPNVMTPDAKERGVIISHAKTIGGIGSAVTVALPIIVGYFVAGRENADILKYAIMAISMSIIGMPIFSMTSFKVKERIQLPDIKKSAKGDTLQISKRSVAFAIIFSLFTGGIYYLYWAYKLIKNTKATKKDNSSCIGEFLCFVFVPFYSYYWWYTRGKLIKEKFMENGCNSASNGVVYLVLDIFGLSIISMGIMQSDYNSLQLESKYIAEPPQFSRLFTCKPLMLVVLSGILSFGRYMLQAAAPHVARYSGLYIGSKPTTLEEYNTNISNVALVIQICAALGMFGAMLVLPKLYKKFEYKSIMLVACIAGFAASVFTVIIGWTTKNLLLCIPFMLISAVPLGVINNVSFAMVCDCLDYLEWKTGLRDTGLGSSCQAFVNQIGNAFATVMIILMYIVVNIDVATLNIGKGQQVVDAINSLSATQNFAMFSLVTIVPGISLILCAIPLFFYDLTGEKKKKVFAELAQLRKERGVEIEE